MAFPNFQEHPSWSELREALEMKGKGWGRVLDNLQDWQHFLDDYQWLRWERSGLQREVQQAKKKLEDWEANLRERDIQNCKDTENLRKIKQRCDALEAENTRIRNEWQRMKKDQENLTAREKDWKIQIEVLKEEEKKLKDENMELKVKLRGGGVPGAPMGPMAMPRAPDFDEPNSLLPSELLGPDQYAGPNSSLPWSDSGDAGFFVRTLGAPEFVPRGP